MAEFGTVEIMEDMGEERQIAVRQELGMVSFADTLMQEVTEAGYWASFPVETMDDKKKLHKARNDNELLRDHMGEVIALADIVLDVQVINDPTVGAKTVPCVHLIAEDGSVYQSCASGVVKSACNIISDFGSPSTWAPGDVTVACKEIPTNSGFRYKYLTLVD